PNPSNLRTTVEGGPAWISSDAYDIHAVATGGASREMMLGPMLQTILEERFKLTIRREDREIEAYALTAAGTGSKRQPYREGSCDNAGEIGTTVQARPATGWSFLQSFEPGGRPLCGASHFSVYRIPVEKDDPTFSWSAIPNQATFEGSRKT